MRKVFEEFDADTGIATTVHQEDDQSKTIIQKTYDAEPLLQYAKTMREATAGKTWGEGRIIGTVPLAVVAEFQRKGITGRELAKELTAWVRANPALICFDKFK